MILGGGAFSYERGTPPYDQPMSPQYRIPYGPMDCPLLNYSRNAMDAGFRTREPNPVWNGTLNSKNNRFTATCNGSEAGSYPRRIDPCMTQLNAQGPSRTCKESKEEAEKGTVPGSLGFGLHVTNVRVNRPRKPLCGGIPSPFLEPSPRSWSHFVGVYRQILTTPLKN